MLQDKVTAAKKIDALLKGLISSGGFRLKYRITVNPPAVPGQETERPEILVELAGPDSDLVLARGGELLRAFENISHEAVHLSPDEHERIAFDCRGYRAARQQELKMAADVAAERVLRTGTPYSFAPMSSRERRLIHLKFRDHQSLTTQSEGEGGRRYVVLYPRDYKPSKPARR
ncbi:MAG TPA: R3H domain-containing nucleic acid-binding protein [Candidatus Limnocylindrales bacterium]|jgi:spoIIIJ-associated protein|nr:R3H domain-containing nucleic acid-binding protein [Candidatus Limnocylindrales bacterium]